MLPQHAIAAAPSVLFDAVALLLSKAGVEAMKSYAPLLNFVRDAHAHLKIIGFAAGSGPLLELAGVEPDDGVVEIDAGQGARAFIAAAKNGRLWARAAMIQA